MVSSYFGAFWLCVFLIPRKFTNFAKNSKFTTFADLATSTRRCWTTLWPTPCPFGAACRSRLTPPSSALSELTVLKRHHTHPSEPALPPARPRCLCAPPRARQVAPTGRAGSEPPSRLSPGHTAAVRRAPCQLRILPSPASTIWRCCGELDDLQRRRAQLQLARGRMGLRSAERGWPAAYHDPGATPGRRR